MSINPKNHIVFISSWCSQVWQQRGVHVLHERFSRAWVGRHDPLPAGDLQPRNHLQYTRLWGIHWLRARAISPACSAVGGGVSARQGKELSVKALQQYLWKLAFMSSLSIYSIYFTFQIHNSLCSGRGFFPVRAVSIIQIILPFFSIYGTSSCHSSPTHVWTLSQMMEHALVCYHLPIPHPQESLKCTDSSLSLLTFILWLFINFLFCFCVFILLHATWITIGF